MQAMVVGGREEMWDSKASAEEISWMVDMFALVGSWRVGSLGNVSEDYCMEDLRMGVEHGNCNERWWGKGRKEENPH